MAALDKDGGAIGADRRRDGRGKLSSIDTLPPEADEHIAWANEQLRDEKVQQTEILREFNERLASIDLGPISKSAFNRYSIRLTIELRKVEASRQITEMILARMPAGQRSDSVIAATELIKYRVLELVTGGDDVDLKSLGQASAMLSTLSATAARENAEQRKDRQEQREEAQRQAIADREAQERADAETAEKVGKIAQELGMTKERIVAIRKGALGLAT